MHTNRNMHIILKAHPPRAGFLVKKYTGIGQVSPEAVRIAMQNPDFSKEVYLDFVQESDDPIVRAMSWNDFKEWLDIGTNILNQIDESINPDKKNEKEELEKNEKKKEKKYWIGFLSISVASILILLYVFSKQNK